MARLRGRVLASLVTAGALLLIYTPPSNADQNSMNKSAQSTTAQLNDMPKRLGKGIPGPYLRDQEGKQIILRGFNYVWGSKSDPDCLSKVTEADIKRDREEMGSNSVRMLLQWRCIEPQPHVYDDDYLTKIENLVSLYNKYGITVLLDMHQDLYSNAITPNKEVGNGAPEWATHMDGKPVTKQDQWWQYYLTPGVIRAYDNFYNRFGNHPELMEHYAAMWGHVAKRFATNPGVFGYDLMNEPSSGSDLMRHIEATALSTLYNKCVNAIRQHDSETWIFLEPVAFGANNGAATELAFMKDPRPGAPKIGYAPHVYPLGSEAGVDAGAVAGVTVTLNRWRDRVRDQARRLSPDNTTVPIMVGEFGLDTRGSGSIKYVENALGVFGQMGAGTMYWTADLGTWGPYDENRKPRNLRDAMANCYVVSSSKILELQSTSPRQCWLKVEPGATLHVWLPTFTFTHGATITGATQTAWDESSRMLTVVTTEKIVEIKPN